MYASMYVCVSYSSKCSILSTLNESSITFTSVAACKSQVKCVCVCGLYVKLVRDMVYTRESENPLPIPVQCL